MKPFMGTRLAVDRFLADSYFVTVSGLPKSAAQGAAGNSVRAWRGVRRRLGGRYQDFVLGDYTRRLTVHYGPRGRGYDGVAELSTEAQLARYRTQRSRLMPIVEKFNGWLDFRNGDSFLDLGCGTGQNIAFLTSRFRDSPVVGTDLNQAALDLIAACEPSPNVLLSQGSILDERFLDALLRDGFDHVVLSHVLSVLFGETREQTRVMRGALIARLAAATRKSLTVIDAVGSQNEFGVVIEQKNRLLIRDDVLSYFQPIEGGEAVLTRTEASEVIMFVRHTPGA